MQITSDNIHGFGSFPGKPWSFKSKFTGDLEPTPLSNQTSGLRGLRLVTGKNRGPEERRSALR
jgi:hypothetical protein